MDDSDKKAEQKIAQYLNEAHASEQALVNVLQAQIAMAPGSTFRDGLETHLSETREHADRLAHRLREMESSGNFLIAGLGVIEGVIGQALALGKTPFDLLRGGSGEEKVLKNAKDACATEALEIATYAALGQLARSVDDKPTADLADSIRADEEKMLARLLEEIPKLTRAVVRAEVRDNPSYEIRETGAADTVRDVGASVTDTAREAAAGGRRIARKARRVPGVAQAEGQVKGVAASEDDLAIAGYGNLTAAEVLERLSGLSQVDLAKVDAFERKNDNRTTIRSRIASLREREPWPGYDELAVEEIRAVLDEGDTGRIKRALSYERSHKNRKGVTQAAKRESAAA